MTLLKRFLILLILIPVLFTMAGCREISTIDIIKKAPEKNENITDVMTGQTLDAPYAADFDVSNVFSNDMVLQRDEYIRVWGTAPESENGKKVSGELRGMFAEALIENGEWTITFGARLEAYAERGERLRIYTDTKEFTFENVLIGDVYMVIGQSNVAYSMDKHWSNVTDPERRGEKKIEKEIPIRIHYNSLTQTQNYPQRGTDEVCEELRNNGRWMRATVNSVRNFSALGYFLAETLVDITDNTVPVGIIEIDGNGQPLGAFMSNEVAEKCKSDTFDEILEYYKTTGINGDAARFMYNHYMYPFEKYAIAGIVWYQGESDYAVDNAKVFAQNFSQLMTYMRGTHNLINKDFPVYIVEYPPMYDTPGSYEPSEFTPQWATIEVGLIRAVNGSISQYLSNSYFMPSSDLWKDTYYHDNLHPNCKFEQGQRMGRLIAASDDLYPMEQATGPILKSVKKSINGKKITLTYENVGEGLKTCDGEELVKGFGIIDGNFTIKGPDDVKIEARITANNQITIESSVKITGIAYNFMKTNTFGIHLNLCNSEGIPAAAVLFIY